MDADNSFYVKFIATYAHTIFGFIISVVAMVSFNLYKVGFASLKCQWLYVIEYWKLETKGQKGQEGQKGQKGLNNLDYLEYCKLDTGDPLRCPELRARPPLLHAHWCLPEIIGQN